MEVAGGNHGSSADNQIEALARKALEQLAQSQNTANQSHQPTPPQADVESFKKAVIANDIIKARREVDRLTAAGTSYEWIADVLIAGAARRLGDMWVKDELSFLQVSLAVSGLLRINAELRSKARRPRASTGALAIFAALKGQAHTLGIVLAAEAFRQHGWDIELLLDSTIENVVQHTTDNKPAIVGLTAGRDDRLSEITELVSRLKSLPQPPRTLLGGHAVVDKGVLENIGQVDAIVTSIEDALVAAGVPEGFD